MTNQQKTTNPTSLGSSSNKKYTILVRCPRCIRLLCKRIPIHDETEELYILHIKHRGLSIYAFDAKIVCVSCGTAVHVSAKDGIIKSVTNNYVD